MTSPADAAVAAALFAVDPVGLGGIALRSTAGPARDAWLAQLRRLLPADAPWRRLPLHIGDERLLGGLDLAATLQAGRPIAQRGLLAEADGGVVLVAMAERLAAGTAARLAAVLDTQHVAMEREGLGERRASRIGLIALDEGIGADEGLSAKLLDRLAFHLTDEAASKENELFQFELADIEKARRALPKVRPGDGVVEALCAAALALGIASIRAPWLALRAACAAAALDGRSEANEDDAALAARLVLASRATQRPASEPSDAEAAEPAESDLPADASPPDDPAPPSDAQDDVSEDLPAAPADAPALDEVVLAAALAAIPPGLLAVLMAGPLTRTAAQRTASGAGALRHGQRRGRPSGVRRGEPRAGARLNLIETLRAAAPWQTLRRREAAGGAASGPRIHVRRDDFHVTRHTQRSETTTVFAVDASGSAALHRLAEAKGAVELLLADCYVRRDSVAVLGFRGQSAELLLPPTRSLVRAKRSLAGLPGGGGTPLAAGIAAAHELADGVRRRGGTAVIVLLTDGRANIARDGTPGRARATADATAAARQLHAAGFRALLLDTSPQPQEAGRQLARDMGAVYLPLPHAGAAAMSQVVQAMSSPAA